MHHKGVALHEGAQVHHLLQLRRRQAPDDRLLVVLRPQLQRPLLQLLQQPQPRLRPMHARFIGNPNHPTCRAKHFPSNNLIPIAKGLNGMGANEGRICK